MPVITLPDGQHRHFDEPVTIMAVAESIGAGLARATLAGRVDGALCDACDLIDRDAELTLITARDPEGLEIIRHSCAHMLGQAVKQLYPDARMAIGPVVNHGFYYDIYYPPGFTPDDLQRIEDRMRSLIEQEYDVIKRVLPRDDVQRIFRERGEEYKLRLIADMPDVEQMALYFHQEYVDMCIGPHVPNTRFCKAFKLTQLAGSYWRGNAANETLQRVYGTAWGDRKALKAHLHRLEEAAKRDHRRIARVQNLFHLQEEAPGMVFWHDRGWRIYLALQDYIRRLLTRHGYHEVHTPQLVDRTLWERSGHWEKFGEDMFYTESEKRTYAVKPMNCPCHVQIFNQGLKSYRDLPLRMAEFGSCHRNEPSGTLHGLMRVRHFVQDDAHIFCTEEQVQSEVAAFIKLVFEAYGDLGFNDVRIALSTRPEQRVGSDAIWDKAESALETALVSAGLDYTLQPGEGAFYGPKVEFALQDSLERVWQCGTIQVDFALPGRLGATYVSETGERREPVMLHRAILGSFERFIGILLEEHAGALPLWLAPDQLAILTITARQDDYARQLHARLTELGFRAALDLRNEKIGYKIREHTLQKVPYMLVLGDREMEHGEVAVRARDGKDLGSLAIDGLVALLKSELGARDRSGPV